MAELREWTEALLETLRQIPPVGTEGQTADSYMESWSHAVETMLNDVRSRALLVVEADNKEDAVKVVATRYLVPEELDMICNLPDSAARIAAVMGMQLHQALRRLALEARDAREQQEAPRERPRRKKTKKAK